MFKNDSTENLPIVYDVSINEKSPSDLDIEIFNNEFGKDTGFIPLLLNPKEEFSLNILMTNFTTMELSSRIVGCKIVDIRMREKNYPFLVRIFRKPLIIPLILTYILLIFVDSVLPWIMKLLK